MFKFLKNISLRNNLKRLIFIFLFSFLFQKSYCSELFCLVPYTYIPVQNKIKVLLEVKSESGRIQLFGGKIFPPLDVVESAKQTFLNKTDGVYENIINRDSFRYVMTLEKESEGFGVKSLDIIFVKVPYVNLDFFVNSEHFNLLKIKKIVWVDLDDLLKIPQRFFILKEDLSVKTDAGENYLLSVACFPIIKNPFFFKKLLELKKVGEASCFGYRYDHDQRCDLVTPCFTAGYFKKNSNRLVTNFFGKKNNYNFVAVFCNAKNEILIHKSDRFFWSLVSGKIDYQDFNRLNFYSNVVRHLDRHAVRKFNFNYILDKVIFVKESNLVLLFLKINQGFVDVSGDQFFRFVKLQDLINTQYSIKTLGGEIFKIFPLFLYILHIPFVLREFKKLDISYYQDEESLFGDLERAINYNLNFG